MGAVQSQMRARPRLTAAHCKRYEDENRCGAPNFGEHGIERIHGRMPRETGIMIAPMSRGPCYVQLRLSFNVTSAKNISSTLFFVPMFRCHLLLRPHGCVQYRASRGNYSTAGYLTSNAARSSRLRQPTSGRCDNPSSRRV